MLLSFIDYVLSYNTHCQYLAEKMAQYETLNLKAKIKIISHLLDQMVEEQGLDTESEECSRKTYLDILACKTMLIFPLWSWSLQAQDGGNPPPQDENAQHKEETQTTPPTTLVNELAEATETKKKAPSSRKKHQI